MTNVVSGSPQLADSDPRAVLHVSPQGNDTNPGTSSKPLRTLEKARDMARVSHAKTIALEAGIYPLTATLALDARDSGVSWKGERARISGGVVIPSSAIKPVTDPAIQARLLPEVRGKVREINLCALGISEYGEVGPHGFGHPYVPAPLELFVDDCPMSLSQWPKAGEPGIPIGKIVDPGSIARNRSEPPRGGVFGLASERPKRWTNADDVWITGLFNAGYADDMVKVSTFDLSNRTISTVQPHCYGFASGKPWNNWRALNLLEEISIPGEYVVDRKAGKVFFLPPEGKDPATSRIEVSVLKDPLVTVRGAKQISFEGVDFTCSRGMGVYIEGGAGNTIRNAIFCNLGTVAVCIGKLQPAPDSDPKAPIPDHFMVNSKSNRSGGTGNGVQHCVIRDVGAGGILLGGGDRLSLEPAGNFVDNCDIGHFNRWDRTYRGAVNIDGVGNVIRHSVLHDSPGLIILLHGNDHLIEYNEIHHGIMVGDDMGAFYMGRDPTERGNILRYNYWHDLGPDHHTYGLYFDDCGGDGSLVFGNVFRNVGYSGTIFVNGGCDFRIENNIFIDSPSKQNGALRGNPSTANQSWSNNVVGFAGTLKALPIDRSPWKDHYPQLLDYLSFKASTGTTRNLDFSRNLLINSTMNPCKFTATDNWVTQGDPGFVDAAKGNYALRSDSEVFRKISGFQPIPFDKIGIETNSPMNH
jgi:hypothetical protein